MSSGPGQVVVIRGAQESEAVGQALQDAFGEDQAALLGLRLQDLEDQLLLAHPGVARDVQVLGYLRQGGDVHLLQVANVQMAVIPGSPFAFRVACGSAFRLVACLALAAVRRCVFDVASFQASTPSRRERFR